MDNELLQAIAQVVRTEVQPIREDIQSLKSDMDAVKQDVSGLKQDMDAVKQDVSGLKQDMDVVKQDLTGVKQEVLKTSITIENRIEPNIRLIAEGHTGIVERLDKIEAKTNEIDEIKCDVSVLKALRAADNR